ncbi:phosphatase PAP2 family protein [bacterium]|nr:phosphatase PAP2 family protein [bacterium]
MTERQKVSHKQVSQKQVSHGQAGARAAQAEQQGWLLVQALRHVWATIRQGWDELGQERRKRWLVTFTWAWVAAILFSFLLTQGTRWLALNGWLTGEEEVLRRLLSIAPLTYITARAIGVLGDTLYLITLVPVTAYLLLRHGRSLRAFVLCMALPMSTLVVGIGWLTWSRSRPDVVLNGLTAPPLHSFPSGHTVHAMIVYGLLAYYWISSSPRRWERFLVGALYVLGTVVIAFTRLEQGAHWPSDIVGSLLIGGFWLAGIIFSMRRA